MRKKIFGAYVNALFGILGSIAAIFLCLFIVCGVLAICEYFNFCITNSQQCLINHGTVFLNYSILAATAFVALAVFKRGKLVDEVNVLLRIRELLNSEKSKEVYRYYDDINNPDIKDVDSLQATEHDVDEYLGVLEHVYSLYVDGIVTKEHVSRQFGYRIKSIAKDKDLVNKISVIEKDFWRDLDSLLKEFASKEYGETKSKLNKQNNKQ